MTYWLIGLVIVAIGGFGLYRAFNSPTFVAGISAIVFSAGWKALVGTIGKRKTPEEEAADRERYRQNDPGRRAEEHDK